MHLNKQRFSPRVLFRRRFLSVPTVIFFAISGSFLFFMVMRFDIDPSSIWRNLQSSDPWLLVLAVVCHYSTFVFRGARWRVLLRNADPNRSNPGGILYCAGLVLISWFVNSVTFMRLGDAHRAFTYSREHGRPLSGILGTIFAERVIDVFILFTMLMISIFLFLMTGVDTPWYIVVFAAIIPIALLAVLGMMILVRSRMLRYLPGPFGDAYLQFHRGALGSFGNFPIFISLGVLGWCAEVARLFFVAEAVGVSIGAAWAIFATLTNTLLTLLPLGGLGVTEFSVAALLSRTVIKSSAGSVVILDRAISYVSVILTGGTLFLIRTILSNHSPHQKQIIISDNKAGLE